MFGSIKRLFKEKVAKREIILIHDLSVFENSDYRISRGWGNHISWMVDDWSEVDFENDTLKVYGHKPRRPRKGDTLTGEMAKSWMLFEFVNVEYMTDPNDMFFADVRLIGYMEKK